MRRTRAQGGRGGCGDHQRIAQSGTPRSVPILGPAEPSGSTPSGGRHACIVHRGSPAQKHGPRTGPHRHHHRRTGAPLSLNLRPRCAKACAANGTAGCQVHPWCTTCRGAAWRNGSHPRQANAVHFERRTIVHKQSTLGSIACQ